MKKLIALAIAATLLLTGCGAGGNDVGGGNKPAFKTAGITLNDTNLFIGGNLSADKKASLGEPISTSEAPSCLYEGMDTIYEYEGFSVQTSQVGDSEIVVMITVETADHTTAKGIKIGDTAEAAANAYGEAVEETRNYVVYNDDTNTTVTFSLKDGKITAIEYAQVNG